MSDMQKRLKKARLSDQLRNKLNDEVATLKARVNQLEREREMLIGYEDQNDEHYKAMRDLRWVLFEWRVHSARRFSIIDGFEGLVKALFVMISPKTADGKDVAPYHVLKAMQTMIEQTRTLGYADFPKIANSQRALIFQNELPPCLRLDSKLPLCDRGTMTSADYHTCRESEWALATTDGTKSEASR